MSPNLTIVPDPAYFEGHFPGQPILPGVALIHLASEAIAHARGQPLPLRGIAYARLRQLVVPGDRLTLAVGSHGTDRLRIDINRGQERIANAELIVGPCETAPAPCPEPSGEIHAAAPPLDALLPHRPPMRFVSAIVQAREEGMTCVVSIPPACALVTDGCAPALAAVEAAAQTAAAWEAVRRMGAAGGGPRVGYLVALRDVAFFAPGLRAGETAFARVRLEAAAVPLTHYRFEVSSGGAAVAGGSIATYLAGSDQTTVPAG